MTLKELNALVAQAETEIRELTTSIDTISRMGDAVNVTVSEVESGSGPKSGLTFRLRLPNQRIRNLLDARLTNAQERHAAVFEKVSRVNELLETLP